MASFVKAFWGTRGREAFERRTLQTADVLYRVGPDFPCLAADVQLALTYNA